MVKSNSGMAPTYKVSLHPNFRGGWHRNVRDSPRSGLSDCTKNRVSFAVCG
jgi:hypothetical protein